MRNLWNQVKIWYDRNFTLKGFAALLFALFVGIPDWQYYLEYWKEQLPTMPTAIQFIVSPIGRVAIFLTVAVFIWLDHRSVLKRRLRHIRNSGESSCKQVPESWAELYNERKKVQQELDDLELGPKPPNTSIGAPVEVRLMTRAELHESQELQRKIERKKKELALIDRKLSGPHFDQAELLALRSLVGELNEEIGSYAANKNTADLINKLSKVERAAGTYGDVTSFRQSIRDIHHILTWMVANKEHGDISMDKDMRTELEAKYQRFLLEINRLI